MFEPQRPLTDDEGLVAIELRESVTAKQIIGAGENQLTEIEASENERPATVYQIQDEGQRMETALPAHQHINAKGEVANKTTARDVIDLKSEPAPYAVANPLPPHVDLMVPAPPRKPRETKPPQQVALADGDDGAGGVDIPDDLKGEIAALLGAA